MLVQRRGGIPSRVTQSGNKRKSLWKGRLSGSKGSPVHRLVFSFGSWWVSGSGLVDTVVKKVSMILLTVPASLANSLSGKTNPGWHLTHVGISPSALSTSPSRPGGQGTRHTGLLEKAGSLKTVQALHCSCGNSDSERKGENRAVAGGKGRNEQFYFKTGDTWLDVRQLSCSLCLLLSNCGNEDKSLHLYKTAVSSTTNMKLFLFSAQFESTDWLE